MKAKAEGKHLTDAELEGLAGGRTPTIMGWLRRLTIMKIKLHYGTFGPDVGGQHQITVTKISNNDDEAQVQLNPRGYSPMQLSDRMR